MVGFVAPWDATGYGLAIGALLLLWVGLYRSRWAWLPFLGFLLIAGFLNASLQLEPPSAANHISRFADSSPRILEGIVTSVEKRAAGGYRLFAEMRHVIQKQYEADVSGDVLIYIGEGELEVRPGQIVRWRSRLRRPVKFGNPGEFDYPLYLAARGIYVTSFLNHADDLVALINHPERQHKTLANLRYKLAAHIEQTLPGDTVGLMQSLLLGIRGGISTDQRKILSESGIAHLFAISGLHFGLLTLLLYQAGKWLYTRSQRLMLWCPPQKVLPVLLIMPMAAYLFLTGNAWATRRAFLAISVIALLFAQGRRTPPFALLATIALALLLFNPLAIFQPGFQLSFAGVTGIVAWLPNWQRPLADFSKPARWPLTMILSTIAATLATAPATLWHFHQFAPAGFLANLIAIPLIAWAAVPIGLVSMAALPLSTLLAEWGLLLSAKFVSITISTAALISKWPGLKVIPYYLTVSTLMILIGGLLTFLPYGFKKRHWVYRLLIVLTTLGVAWLSQPQVDAFQVTALSVGQGDATLVSLPDDRHYLIDGGGMPGSSFDPGEQLVGPALGRMGIEHLQGIILTHNHPDHSSGLIYILQRFQVEAFYFTGSAGELPPELLKPLQQHNIKMHSIAKGWTQLENRSGQLFSIFAPSQKAQDINERSIAVFAGDQENGALLTADLGKSGLQQLAEAGVPGRGSLLKLPHHGSRHAQPGLYLDLMQPSTVFVSSGRGNPYGFPHQPTIDACTTRRIPLYRTDHHGMLTFRIENGRWQAQAVNTL